MKPLLALIVLISCCCGCQPQSIHRETRFLMDTVCTISTDKNYAAAMDDAFALVTEIQNAVNLYEPTSTVSRLNQAPAGEPVSLDPHTTEILKTALAICEDSHGAFDITIAPISALWDFKAEPPALPENAAITTALSLVDYRHLTFDPEAQTLTKTLDGVGIDLGGAAKGYAADRAAALLQESGVPYALLNFGGNVVAFGKNPTRKDGSWQVGIQKPFAAAGSYSHTVTLEQKGAVVTSGTYQRNFTLGDTLYHHILDPQTGYPVTECPAGVTICADSALVADCLSTACMVLGEDARQALAEQYHATLWIEN